MNLIYTYGKINVIYVMKGALHEETNYLYNAANSRKVARTL